MNLKEFIISMLSESGKVSHKRFISVSITGVICFISVWSTVKYPQYIPNTLYSLLIFVAVMSGVATVAQIVALVRGTPVKEEENKQQ